ncbi:PEP-CTERM sorting domain-containing protein [Leptothrix discophora]|uniref:PEPxxWA-CTERM sorting domain-containing protein n=1 Tax=Leptothrix discophora TaxID=89 RepID=A0ABT9FYM2_LEPDI|nr:PEP-CTERM sorting domain-containing protein [Leptothrix discophora]MDP4299073.1 PEPxxWA-CTERM sorting domain-containing protein [Leptothrix discophora]
MNTLHHTLRTAALAATLALAGHAQAAGTTTVLGTFDTDLSGWTSVGVDWTTFGAHFNSSADRLTRSFAVLAGYTYTLAFDYAASGSTGNGLRLDFNGLGFSTPTALTFVPSNGAPTSGSYSFVAANDANTVIRFLGTQKNTYLDNVTITAAAPVPEPETYAMMLAGLGAIGYLSRRRKAAQA